MNGAEQLSRSAPVVADIIRRPWIGSDGTAAQAKQNQQNSENND